MKRSNQFSKTIVGLFTLGGLLLFTMVFPFISPAGELQRAWQHANDVGVYTYKTEIIQTAHPLPILANVGLSSTENRIYIQGKVNRPTKQMQLAMWDGSQVAVAAASESPQSVTNSSAALVAPYNSIQIKVDKDKSYGRTSAGEWQELKDQDVTGVFAPGKDVLGYLAAAKNVKPGATEIQGGIISTRYAFDVDGPTFAQYMKKQLQAELQRKGKLPPGLSLDMAKQYAQWKGTGEMWVNAQGLPLRQTVKVAFPHPYNQETVEATIRTDFSNWRGNSNTGWAGLTMPQMSRDDTQQASLTLAFLVFLLAGMGLMLRHWRSRRVYLVLALYVIIAMPLTPLFQGLQTHAFASEQQEKQQQQQQQQETNKALKQVEEEMLRPTMDPHTDPLLASRLQNEINTYQSAPIYASDIAPNRNLSSSKKIALLQATQTPVPPPVDTDKDGLSDDDEKKYGTDTNKTDTDGDSLSDWQEVQIGINPLDVDTDGDGISDKTEVTGFMSSGKRWFLNPLEPDTNKDGLSDGVECVELLDVAFDSDLNRNVLDSSVNVSGKTCGDANGDGRPNAWTYDDDADGVPDSLDASPLRAMGGKREGKTIAGFANQTLDFQLDKVNAGKPTFVDFQIRPTNSKHLAYANNVLDWPSNDRAGQIQRVKDTTFRQFNGDSQPSDPKDSNGDLRLLPMLEIEIPYQQGTAGGLPTKCNVAAGSCPQGNDDSVNSWLENWLDKTALEDYGISVRAKDNTGSLLAYVPLNVISDPNGDNPVAFAGRMYYRPNTANFGLTQKVRLVWMMQALTDQCTATPTDFMKDAESATRYDAWCKDPTHWQTAVSSIHTYYDDWYLTGLSVREDQGGKMGAIYQPPTAGQTYDKYLWTVAQGLEKSFVPARADLTIDEIKTRFDAASNTNSTDIQRWGIPKNALKVRVESFKDESGVANFPTKYNQEILNSSFSSSNAATILYVREDTARTVSLDLDSDVIQASQAQLAPGFIAGSALTVKLDPNVVPSETMLSMNWASFRKNDASWEAYPIDDYNQNLAETFTPLLKGDNQDEEITAGKVVYLQSFYLALVSGVQYTGNRLDVRTDDILKAALNPADPARNLIKGYVSQDGIDQDSAFKQLGVVRNGGTPKTGASKARSSERSSVVQASGLVAGMQSALKTYMLIKSNPKLSITNGKQTQWGVLAVKGGIQAKGIYSGLKEAKDVANATKQVNSAANAGKLARRGGMLVTSYKGAVSAAKAVKTVKSITSGAKFLAGLGCVLAIGISVGTFAYLWGSGAIKPGTPAFNQALALMIGEIIVAVIMLAIELIPGVGPIIVAVIALIDVIIGAICKAIGAKGDVADFVCSGLTGMLAQTLANIFYRYEPWVDLNREDRLEIGGLQQNLVNPTQGFVVGNTLQISAKVKSEIFKKESTTASDVADVVLGIFTFGASTLWTAIAKPKPDVRTTTLKYQLTRTKEEGDKRVHKRLKLEPGQMNDEWKKNDNKLTQDVVFLLPLDKPGINVPDTGSAFYLAEGQAYNATETKASVSFEKKDVYESLYISMGPGAVFDTLPATLDGFYELAPRGGGYALAWDSKFPTLADADGDGLRSGSDPDDSQFDTDGDGLSDFYEVQYAAQGFDPKKADTDGDGLIDYEELIYGTDPAKADSDYDGLTDYFEINGWDIVYGKDANGKLIAHVTSDPFNRDTDNDTISDYREMVFGTNPRVWSDPQVVKISSKIDDADGYVAPSQIINYTADIANKMLGRDVRGLLEVDFPPAVQDIRVQPKPFSLGPEQQTTMQGSVQVRPDAPTQKLDFTNRASSFIPNDQSQVTRPLNNNKDDFIMRFDEPPKATSFTMGARDKDLAFSCEESNCPDSGLPGVYSQAARFEAGDKLANKDFSLSDMAAFGIWVNPSTQTTNEATIVDFIDYTNGSSIFRLGYDVSKKQVYFQFKSGDKSYHSTAVPVGQWTFVSITLGENISFSVNGTQQTIATNSAYSGKYSPAIGGVNGTFTGLLDHFSIRRYIKYGIAFDEEDSKASSFAVAMIRGSGDKLSLTCANSKVEDCPTPNQTGKSGKAILFKENSRLQSSLKISSPKSIDFWLKPEQNSSGHQVILSFYKNGGKSDFDFIPQLYSIVYESTVFIGKKTQKETQKAQGKICLQSVTKNKYNEYYSENRHCTSELTVSYGDSLLVHYDSNGVSVKLGDKTESVSSGTFNPNDTTLYMGNYYKNYFDLKDTSTLQLAKSFIGYVDEISIDTNDSYAGIGMLRQAPVMTLHFDEPLDSTTFGNANHVLMKDDVTCSGDKCPKSGAKGQIRSAIQFDGVDDVLNVPGSNYFDEGYFGVAMWLKPTAKVGKSQTLLDKYTPASTGGMFNPTGFNLSLDSELRPTFGAYISKDTCGVLGSKWYDSHTSPTSLPLNEWSYIVVTHDLSNGTKIYVNGYSAENSGGSGGMICTEKNQKLTIGDNAPPPTDIKYKSRSNAPFVGSMDELSLFAEEVLASYSWFREAETAGALPAASQIAGTFNYQGAWYDATASHQVVIDADRPTVKLDVSATHLLKRDVVMSIAAQDATSGLATVEYQLDNGPWNQPNLDGGVWSFTYQPPSAGKHTIAVRSIDRVGNWASQSTDLIIDDAAPIISLNGAGVNEPQPIKADSAKDTWLMTLSGKVTESGTNDSGVQAVTVTFFDKAGGYIGKSRTTQTFAKDGTWKVDYSLGLKPDGFYPVQVEAVDKVGNLRSKDFTLALETTAPTADLATTSTYRDAKGDLIPNVLVGMGSNRPLLQGTISDLPPPQNALLAMHFEEAAGATLFRNSSGLLNGTCNGASCPLAGISGKYGNGLTFAGDDLVTLTEGANYRQTADLLKNDPNAYPKAANLPSKAMTVAAWVSVKQQNNLDGFVSAMQAVGGNEKGWMLGSRNGRFVFALASTEADDGDGFMTYLEAPDQYTVGQWYYVVGTYDGTTMKIYVDGDLKATSDVQAGDILYPPSAWFGLGAYSDGDEEYRFNGQLDEVALYERALRSNDIESQFVAASGIGTLELGLQHVKDKATNAPSQWFTVPLTLTQQRQNYATWSYQIPEGFEGPYSLWLRATDKAGNAREIPNVWQGILDTKAPQIALSPVDLNGKVEYTTKVEDFNLSAKDFNSPCGMEVTKSKENNAETWYKETFAAVDKDGKQIPAPNKLYRMTAQCEITGTLSYQEVAVLQGKQVDIAANYAYVLQENSTDFSTFDLSNPTKPNLLELKKWWFPIVSLTPSTDNTYLNYAFSNGFAVYNVADFVVAKKDFYSYLFIDIGYKNLTGVYTSKGSKYAYVMEDLYWPPLTTSMTPEEFKKQTRQGKVTIFDYEQKQLRKGSYEDPAPSYVGVYGNNLLITGNHYGETKLKVLDVSDPDAKFKEVAIYNNPLGNGFTLDGQYLYTVNNNGLQIFDLSQIKAEQIPQQTCEPSYGWFPRCYLNRSYPDLSSVGSYGTWGYANDVAVVGNTAYLAGRNGVERVDVTDKKNIRHIARYVPPPERKVDQVKVQGDTLFVKVTDPWDHNPSIRAVQLSKDNLPTATACDTFGNCTTQKVVLTAAIQAATLAADSASPSLQADPPPSPITVEVGPVPTTLNEARPISFTVKLQATAGLKDVTVSIDGATLASQSWASSEVITNIVGALPMWVPKTEGQHTLVVQATDRNGATVRDESTTITLDTQAPALTLKQTKALNSQNYNAGTFMLQGTVTDTVSLGSVAATLRTAKGSENLPVTFTDAAGSELTIPTTFANGTTTTGTVQWQAPLSFSGTSPNGLTATLTLTATDLVGHQTAVQKPLLIDAVAPTQGNITLGYKVKDQTTVITPGMTLASVLDPEMVINWPPASDPSNIKRYFAGWSTSPTPTLSTLTSYGMGDSSHLQKVSDGQKWYAHVVAEDEAGNQATSTLGPIYVDYATTPNYISMQENGVFPYRSWSESKCSLVGVDNRINERANSIASLKDSQKLYTTWNHDGLRLMWTGANWDVDGDLFIYLDTKDGGSSQLYNPYPATSANTAILLPPTNDVSSLAALQSSMPARPRLSATKGQMAADALLWVQGSMTATLLLWNGTTWQPSEGLTYFFDQNQAIPTTDLYVPFSALGIQAPTATTLSMLAVASEEKALRLWATMPSRNNLNSDRIVDSKGASGLQQFALTKNYTWKLTDGVCPGVMPEASQSTTLQADATSGAATGADVKVSISSYPSGVAYSLLNDNLFFTMKDLPQFAGIDWGNTSTAFCAKNPDDAACRRDTVTKSALQGTAEGGRLASLEPPDGGFAFNAQTKLAATMNVNTPPVGDKNLIVHTLELVNKGTETAKGIVADVSTWGAIRLPGGTKQTDSAGEYDAKTLQIGDLAPGKRIQVPIPAIVDATFDKQNQHGKARLDVTVYDSTGSHQQLPDGTDVYSNELDWLYVDHAVDTSPPDYIEILSPRGILGPGQNTINGFVYDRSAVPTIEMEIQRPDSTTRSIVCKDENPEDSAWACVMNTEGAKEGETFGLRVRATDKYGYVGAWSSWSKFVVDATPPKVSLNAASQAVLSSGLVGYNQARLSGTITDNRQISGVDVCEVADGAESCERANILPNSATEVKTTYAYEDKPDAPLAIGKNTPCTTPLVRTFVVTDNFTISRASVGLNLAHTLRGDLNVTLQSPKGTKVTLLYDGTKARNYDVLIDDASATLDHDDQVDHDLASPPYKNQRGGYGLLSTFNGEAAAGTWKLTTCDAFPSSDDGAYNQSKLILESTALPSNTTATWNYTLPIPEPTVTVQEVGQLVSTANTTSTAQFAPNLNLPFAVFIPLVQKDVSIVNDLSAATPIPTASSPTAIPSTAVDPSPKTLAIYGVDRMGNRTNQPLRSTYRVDNTPPAIQLTTDTSLTLKVSDIFTGSTKLHLAGQVIDKAGIKDLRLVLLRPDSIAVTDPLTVTQTTWEYNSTHLLDMAGTYQWWVEANDNSLNLRRVGPFTILVQGE